MCKQLRRHGIISLTLGFNVLVSLPTIAASRTFPIVIETGQAARRNRPVTVTLPERVARSVTDQTIRNGGTISGRINGASVTFPACIERTVDGPRLHFVLGRAEAGESHAMTLTLDSKPAEADASFRFVDKPGEYQDCMLGQSNVLRYMYARDESNHLETYKVFHHIYGYHGEPFITKGAGGTYTHHRGMFIGFNKTRVGDKQYDFWHMKPMGTIQKHLGFADTALANPIVGRQTAQIGWITPDGNKVIEEDRTLAAYWQPPGQSLFDIDITLRSKAGTIRLDGDLQHAGFQVRAAQEIHDNRAKSVYYIPTGSTRGKDDDVKGAWAACTFKLAGHPYVVMYLTHPANPHRDTAVLSTRDYARLGEFFPTDLVEKQPLRMRYRVIVMDTDRHGKVSAERVQGKYDDYTQPVNVTFGD
jgi:hypothetical protein